MVKQATECVGIREIASMFDVTEKSVRNWIDRKADPLPVIRGGRRGAPHRFPLSECHAWGVRQELAKVIDDDGEMLDYTQERAKLAREQRRKHSIEIEVLRRNLIPREEVEEMLGRMITAAKARLLSIPDKAPPVLVAMAEPEIRGTLTDYIHEALKELSTGSLEPVGAAPAADGERVGGRESDAERGGERGTRPVEH